MSDAEKLYKELLHRMSSPEGESLHEFVLAGDKRSALNLLLQRRFNANDAETLYEYCAQKWLGSDVDLVEVPLAEVPALLEADMAKFEAGQGELDYLIRDGASVVSAHLFGRGIGVELYVPGRGPIKQERILQLWRVVPKSSSPA